MALPKVKKKAKGTKARKGGGGKTIKLGFDEWENMESREDMEKAIAGLLKPLIDNLIREGMDIAEKEYEVWAYFHDDSLRLTVSMPFGPDEDEGPYWNLSLHQIVEDEIELYLPGGGLLFGRPTATVLDPEEKRGREKLKNMRDMFLGAIRLIDVALGEVKLEQTG